MTSELTLIDELLEEQQRLTAVERFAFRHERHAFPARTALYRDLLPATPPAEGEQYAFSVDLDACSGCKACVTACHSLNGLDDEETWRSVGLLHGGTSESPFQQTVTTACHHCVDPACLNGCPVLAYEKDPLTGIVRHLDDQCIGCQYCILKCPYDVPKYSAKRGIVRKCDMCSGRLAVGEAPACAQACPNQAITITIVSKAEAASKATVGEFLPGTPDPVYTIPTTTYTTSRGLPKNVASGDQHSIKPGHSHPPLVIMLVLTQLSVGAFCIETLLRASFPANLMTQLSPLQAFMAFALGMLALGASTCHLGRPLYAWRAVLGLRNSWLSREIIVFGIFAGLATLEAAAGFLTGFGGLKSLGMSMAISATGLFGVFCSLMIYRDTRREFWNGPATGLKFFGTTALLGVASILFITTFQALLFPMVAVNGAYHELTSFLTVTLAGVSAGKLLVEAEVFRHLHANKRAGLRRTARLLIGELAEIVSARFFLGVIGGVVLPLVFLVQSPAPGYATLGVTLWILLFVLLGELVERYLFFVAVASPTMPGGIGS
jgi:Fe-S-cluster-containing dehydrogenase component/DMSO reductase anchor subunit